MEYYYSLVKEAEPKLHFCVSQSSSNQALITRINGSDCRNTKRTVGGVAGVGSSPKFLLFFGVGTLIIHLFLLINASWFALKILWFDLWGEVVGLWGKSVGCGSWVSCGGVGCLIFRSHTASHSLISSEPHSRVRLAFLVNLTQSAIRK